MVEAEAMAATVADRAARPVTAEAILLVVGIPVAEGIPAVVIASFKWQV
jgi:hypothetical protein